MTYPELHRHSGDGTCPVLKVRNAVVLTVISVLVKKKRIGILDPASGKMSGNEPETKIIPSIA